MDDRRGGSTIVYQLIESVMTNDSELSHVLGSQFLDTVLASRKNESVSALII